MLPLAVATVSRAQLRFPRLLAPPRPLAEAHLASAGRLRVSIRPEAALLAANSRCSCELDSGGLGNGLPAQTSVTGPVREGPGGTGWGSRKRDGREAVREVLGWRGQRKLIRTAPDKQSGRRGGSLRSSASCLRA